MYGGLSFTYIKSASPWEWPWSTFLQPFL